MAESKREKDLHFVSKFYLTYFLVFIVVGVLSLLLQPSSMIWFCFGVAIALMIFALWFEARANCLQWEHELKENRRFGRVVSMKIREEQS